MDITVYALCYNEEELLPFFLDYYSRFALKIVIWDNYSTDATEAIANSYKKTKVEIHKFNTNNEFREDINVYIKNHCWKGDKADLVIVCDVDEFLYAVDIPDFLARRQEFHVFKPVGYNMVSENFPEYGPLLITEQIKSGVMAENYSKVVLFNPKMVTEIDYGIGAHIARPRGTSIMRPYDARDFNEELKLLHYKNISFEYRQRKNWEYAPRVGAISKKSNWNYHFSYDEQTQRAEFDSLLRDAKKILP
jgi:glycosyltransferase involved in cell wall biosynthesis